MDDSLRVRHMFLLDEVANIPTPAFSVKKQENGKVPALTMET